MNRLLARAGCVVLLVAAFTMLASAHLALAACTTSELTGTTTCLLTTPAIPAKSELIGDGRTSSYVWLQVPLNVDDARTRSAICERTDVDGATVNIEYGNVYVVALYTADGTQVVAPHTVCVFAGDPAPEPPPPPPTAAEFVEAARKAATIETSLNPRPDIGGLTGLDTWLWCTSPEQLQVTVALRGWTATATLDPVDFVWAIDGLGHALFHSASCGSETAPAATWTPQTLGAYTVTFTTTWAGSWTLAYNAVPAGVFPLGPFDFAAPTVPYPIGEYRGVLTPPGAGQP